METPSPKTEAQALLQMLWRNGTTVESIRELIAIPTESEQLLCASGVRYPENQKSFKRVIEFRRRVGEEFER